MRRGVAYDIGQQLMPMQNRQYFLQIKQNKRDNHSHVLDVSSDKILHNSRRLFG